MPFVFPHVALMPDAHLGKGATVGSVIPTLGAIIPAAVGVDIGCGMIAVRTQFTTRRVSSGLIAARAAGCHRGSHPAVGWQVQRCAHRHCSRPRRNASRESDAELRLRAVTPAIGGCSWGRWGRVTTSSRSPSTRRLRVWLFLHSGSRGVGNKIAQRHIEVARKLCQQWWIELPDPDLAYLVEGTDEFWAYMRDLRWAQKFALLNREEMMDRVDRVL